MATVVVAMLAIASAARATAAEPRRDHAVSVEIDDLRASAADPSGLLHP
jgi:hypothetical protein